MPKTFPQLSILKIGGSVIFSNNLDAWLQAIARTSKQILLTTGGGPFADAIRTAYTPLRLREEIAHEMAILSLEQTAAAIADKHERFVRARSMGDIKDVLDEGQIPVWAPVKMTRKADDIEPSWRVTSDSLALWLAAKCAGKQLFLIKSTPLEQKPHEAEALVAEGIIDDAFPEGMERSQIKSFLLSPGDWRTLDEQLATGGIRPIFL